MSDSFDPPISPVIAPDSPDGVAEDISTAEHSHQKAPAQRQGRSSFLRASGIALALLLTLGLAAYLRLTGINWDSFTHLHPDERFITMVETSLDWPKTLEEYFDSARSTLNPYNRGYNSFVYGTFPLFLVKWLGIQLHMIGYDEIHLVGRAASAAFDLGSVLLIFFIGRRLFSTRSGSLASILTSGAVIHIQQSHFFTFDTFVAFFLLSAFYFSVRIWQQPHALDYPLLGASLGLGMASKINSALFALIVALVAIKQLREVTINEPNDRMAEWMSVVGRFSAAALTGLIVFRLAEPYAFSGPGFLNMGLSTKFLNDMGFVAKLVSGEVDQPPGVQWAGTPAYLFPLQNLVLWGMGLPLGLLGWAGFLFGAFRLFKYRDSAYFLIVAWVGFFFFYQGGQFAKTMRYFLPIVPLLALLGAQLLFAGLDWIRKGPPDSGVACRLAKVGRPAIVALGILVAAGTILYAVAFTRIYNQPVTRIAATEWIFANIPQGTAIADEHWDDPLPLRWKGKDAGYYSGDLLELYNEDNPEKYRKLVGQLDRTEYIFLTSNRLYGSIPRMPMKYPMTTEYYRLLFSGELGFALEKTFASHPQLFGIEINDDGAEEIFSVYDHPKVLIFHKTAGYSPEKTRRLLGAVPLDNVLNVRSVEAQYNGLLLSPAARQAQESGGTWSDMYDRDGLVNRFPTLAWWLALEVIGLLALPITWIVFRRFPDRGYGLSKILGLVVVTYIAWLLASMRVVPFGPGAIGIGIGFVVVAAAAVLARHGAQIVEFLRAQRTVILVHELVFLAAFGLFWMIRANNPDLWHLNFGGEKPMEFAYLNAVAKSTHFPPFDPWFAGGYINYYYFGYVIVAGLMRLTGVVPAIAFNLAVPTMFALTAAGLFSFGLNFAAARRLGGRVLSGRTFLSGLGPVLFVLILGNLDGFIQRLESLWAIGGMQFKSSIPFLEGLVKAWPGLVGVLVGGKNLPPLDFWRSTRLVPGESPAPIMEFPFFTFLYSDLHPHMISMPIAVLALGLVLSIVWQGGRRQLSAISHRMPAVTRQPAFAEDSADPLPVAGGSFVEVQTEDRGWATWERGLVILFAGLVVGTLQATNSWDFPTYLLLICTAYLVASYARDRALTLDGIVAALVSAGLTFGVAQVLFLPYTRNYQLFYNGVDPSPAKTDISYYLVMFGFFLVCMSSALLVGVINDRSHRFRIRDLAERLSGSPRWERRRALMRALVRPTPWMELLPWAALFLAIVVTLLAVSRQYLVALLAALCLLALLALFERDATPERMLLALFVGLGAVLTLGVEFITIKGDIGRMNTVFKFYLQAWFLFGVASALLAAGLATKWRSDSLGWRPVWRRLWVWGVVLLFGAALFYPIGATPTKVGARFTNISPTLDGMAYMRVAPPFKEQNNTDIVLARDYSAITWLQDNIAGSPTVLEAQVPEYRWGSRVSIYTGLPTILGWTWHQRQQRGNYGWMIDARLKDIKLMYESTDPIQTAALLKKYEVGLVYVGDLERAYYPEAGLAKFERMTSSGLLSAVYRANGVVVYEVKREGQPELVKSHGALPAPR